MNIRKIKKFKMLICILLLLIMVFSSFAVVKVEASVNMGSYTNVRPAFGLPWPINKIPEAIENMLDDIYNFFSEAPIIKMKEALFAPTNVKQYISGQTTSESPLVVNRIKGWYDLFQVAGLMFIPLIALKVAILLMSSWVNPNNRKELKQFISTSILVVIILVFAEQALDWFVSLNDAIVSLFVESSNGIIPSVRPNGLGGIPALLLAIVIALAAWVMSLYIWLVLFIRQVIIAFAYMLIPVAAMTLYTKQMRGVLNAVYKEILASVFTQAVYAATFVLLYDVIVYISSFVDAGFTVGGTDEAQGFALDSWFVQHVNITYDSATATNLTHDIWILGPLGWAVLLYLLLKVPKFIQGLFSLKTQWGPDAGALMKKGAGLGLKGLGTAASGLAWSAKSLPAGFEKMRNFNESRKANGLWKTMKSGAGKPFKKLGEKVNKIKTSDKPVEELAKGLLSGTANLGNLITGVSAPFADAAFAIAGVTNFGDIRKARKGIKGNLDKGIYDLKDKSKLSKQDMERKFKDKDGKELEVDDLRKSGFDLGKGTDGNIYARGYNSETAQYEYFKIDKNGKKKYLNEAKDREKMYTDMQKVKSEFSSYSDEMVRPDLIDQILSENALPQSDIQPSGYLPLNKEQIEHMGIKKSHSRIKVAHDESSGESYIKTSDSRYFKMDSSGISEVHEGSINNLSDLSWNDYKNLGLHSDNETYIFSEDPGKIMSQRMEKIFESNDSPISASFEANKVMPSRVVRQAIDGGHNEIICTINPSTSKVTVSGVDIDSGKTFLLDDNIELTDDLYDTLYQQGVLENYENACVQAGILEQGEALTREKFQEFTEKMEKGCTIGMKLDGENANFVGDLTATDTTDMLSMIEGIRNAKYEIIKRGQDQSCKKLEELKYQLKEELGIEDINEISDDVYEQWEKALFDEETPLEAEEQLYKQVEFKQKIEDEIARKEAFEEELNRRNELNSMIMNDYSIHAALKGIDTNYVTSEETRGIDTKIMEAMRQMNLYDQKIDELKKLKDFEDQSELTEKVKELLDNLDEEEQKILDQINEKDDLDELIEHVTKKHRKKSEHYHELIEKRTEIKKKK